MSQYAIFVQEGFGTDGHTLYFTNEPPVYEAEEFPVFATANDDPSKKVHVGDRQETFCIFTPLNGPYRQRNKPNRIPFHRVLSVVEQSNDEGDDHAEV